jgi:hypothetical protein
MNIAFRAGMVVCTRRRIDNSRVEFQLSHKCVWRMMRLFVMAMGKTENCKLLGLT